MSSSISAARAASSLPTNSQIPLPPYFQSASALANAVPQGFQSISEGGAVALFRTGEVFYNQVQIFNRDLSIMSIRAWDELRCEAEDSAKAIRKAWGQRGVRVAGGGGGGKGGKGEESSAAASSASSSSVATTFPPMRILEALSASGLRSVRYAKEIPRSRLERIVANDLDPAAIEAVKRNIAANGLLPKEGEDPMGLVVGNAGDAVLVMQLASRGIALPGMEWMRTGRGQGQGQGQGKSEGGGGGSAAAAAAGAGASDHSSSSSAKTPFYTGSSYTFDVVDLDPYGSASPFLDSALQAVADGGLLCITCTDMAVLAGSHADVCHAKYGAVPVRARHYNEQALRILLACVEGHANRHKRTVRPLLSVSVDFYIRVFVTVHASPSGSNESANKIGNLYQCSGCDSFWMWSRGKRKGGERGLFIPRGSHTTPAAAAARNGNTTHNARAEGVAEEGLLAEGGEGDASGSSASASAAAAAGGGGGAAPGHGTKRKKSQVHGGPAPEDGGKGEKGVGAQAATANYAPDVPCNCPHCGRRVQIGGPLWIDPIHDRAFAKRVLSLMEANFGVEGRGGGGASSAAARSPYTLPPAEGEEGASGGSSTSSSSSSSSSTSAHLLCIPRPSHDGGSNDVQTVASSRRRLMGVIRSVVDEELNIPLYYEVATLASRLRVSSPQLGLLQAALMSAGYSVSGSHCASNVVKTDASNAVVWDIMREWARKVEAEEEEKGEAGRTAAAVGAGGAASSSSSSSPQGQASPLPLPLTSLPVDQAMRESAARASPSGRQSSPAELGAISWVAPAGQRTKADELRALRPSGVGQRFISNPGQGWGPKAKASSHAHAHAHAQAQGAAAGGGDGESGGVAKDGRGKRARQQ